MITAHLTGFSISSVSEEAFSLYEKSSFGEKKADKIEYSAPEAIFLLELKKISIFKNRKSISHEQLIKILKKKDKRIELKYIIFKDLRKKGYIVKTALKYGADFRVYDKGYKPSEAHARWILFATKEHAILSWQDFVAKNRIAHSVKKNLLIAIVDEESDISYYESSWVRT